MIEVGEVERIARLARLDLDEESSLRMAADLSKILEYVETLRDLEDTPELLERSPMETQPDLVDDRRVGRERIAEIAPEFEKGFFVVPPVIG